MRRKRKPTLSADIEAQCGTNKEKTDYTASLMWYEIWRSRLYQLALRLNLVRIYLADWQLINTIEEKVFFQQVR